MKDPIFWVLALCNHDIKSTICAIAKFNLSELTSQEVIQLISTLNSSEILHAVSGEILKVPDDDKETVSALLCSFTESAKTENSEITGTEKAASIRYDISEMHEFEIENLKTKLQKANVKHHISQDILTASRGSEDLIDKAIYESEQELQRLEEVQLHARQVQTGVSSPTCESCGASPAAILDLKRQVGMVILMKTYRAEMTLCENCAKVAYKQFQKSTAIKGWTGFRSALMNPIVIGTNALSKNKHSKKLREKGVR